MPVYNGQEYLQDAIDAILRQSFEDFELIISDNCSTDRTAEICETLAARDARIRFVRQSKNLGAIGNFNALVHLANGRYFKWAAHDDLMEPSFLQRCVDALDQDESLAWCHSRSDMIDAGGRSFREILPPDDPALRVDSDGEVAWEGHPRDGVDSHDPIARFKGVILGTNWCVDSYGLFRLESLKQTRLLLPFYGAEKVLMGEISLLGRYHEVPELLFYQRVHDNASSNLNSASEQANFADSKRKASPFVSTRLPILKAHFGAVVHASLSGSQKLRGWMVVLQYVFQFKKWKSVAGRVIHGHGLGGGGRRILQSAEVSGDRRSRQILDQPKKTT